MTGDTHRPDHAPRREVQRYVVQYIGRVQGVGFRATAVSLARDLPVSGSVKNNDDGSVTLDVEGEPSRVDELLERIQTAMSGKIFSSSVDRRPPLERTGKLRVEF